MATLVSKGQRHLNLYGSRSVRYFPFVLYINKDVEARSSSLAARSTVKTLDDLLPRTYTGLADSFWALPEICHRTEYSDALNERETYQDITSISSTNFMGAHTRFFSLIQHFRAQTNGQGSRKRVR